MENEQTTAAQPYATGQVSLPNDGQVLSTDEPSVGSTDTPNSNGNAESNTPAPPPQNGPAKPPIPPMPKPSPNQPNQPTQTGQTPAPLNAPQKTLQNGPADPFKPTNEQDKQVYADHPSVQRAGLLNAIGRVLAGNPQDVKIDPQTGQEIRTDRPLSGKQIALAVAVEALAGAAAGAGVKPGPGVVGRAAAAGAGEGLGLQQQMQAKKEAISQQDYNRGLQLTELNMKLHNNALVVGRMGFDNNEAYVDTYKDIRDRLESQYANYIEAHNVTYADLPKYNVTAQTAIPESVTPRLDKNGKQVSIDGVPQWDINYMVVDPKQLKASGLLTEADQKTANDWNLGKVFSNPNLLDSPLGLTTILDTKAKINSLDLVDQEYQNFFKTLNEAGGATSYQGLDDIQLSDPKVNALAEQAANKYGIDPAFVKGIIKQESGGTNGLTSSAGAQGIMQLMPNTAAMLGVTDPNDAEQNIDAGTRYFAGLLAKYHGDAKLALAAYNAGPNNVTDKIPNISETQNYVNSISKAINLDGAKVVESSSSNLKPMDLHRMAHADPTFANAMYQFQGYLGRTGGDFGKAVMAMSSADPKTGAPQNAAKIIAAFGGEGGDGLKNLQRYDLLHEINNLSQKEAAQAQIEEEKAENIAEGKAKVTAQAYEKMLDYLKVPDNFQFNDSYISDNPQQLAKNLQSQGVKVPLNLPALWDIAHYRTELGKTVPGRVWATGSPGEMDSQTAISYIQNFINPNFDEKNYSTYQKIRDQVYVPGPKNVIMNADTAINHLTLFKQAASALKNGNVTPLNSLANMMGVSYEGQAAPAVAAAIGRKVSAEVERVAMGGNQPYAADLEHGQTELSGANAKNAPAVMEGVANAYMGLIGGRLGSIDYDLQSIMGEHLKNVTPAVTKALQGVGQDTPWAEGQATQNTNQPNQPNQPAKAWVVPQGAPSAAGVQNGVPLYQTVGGKKVVVAVAQNGEWTDPSKWKTQ